MSLQRVSGLVLCLMVLFVMGCGSGSDSPAGDRTGGGGTESGGDSGSTGGNGTGDGVVDAPGDGGDTEEPDLGDGMACWIGTPYTAEPDDSTGGVPEPGAGTDDSGSMEMGASDSSDDDTATTNPGDVDDPMPLQGTVEMDEVLTDLETDAYEIAIAGDAAPEIMDDTLTVTLSRGGGCADHDFTLVVDSKSRMREPPELDFTIVHDNMGDVCEAYLTDEVEFDLTQIKDLVGGGVVSLAFQTPDGSACDYEGLEYDTATGSSP